MEKNKVIILTGPGGFGKSTIAELLENKHGYLLIDGDQLDSEFFLNGGQWFPENKEKLKRAHRKIFLETQKAFDLGRGVVIDYIIFGEYLDFFDKFRKEFSVLRQIKQ